MRKAAMKATSQPLVSIVTPVYNGARYFAECIESILAQTYTNWEYTILNNCSTDQSAEIARSYAKRDSRIRVLENQEFLPVIANHNAALRQIHPSSKYCKFVFADDWIFPECIEQMVEVAEGHPSIGLVGAYVLKGLEIKCAGLPYESSRFDGREICRQHFLNRLYVFESANAVLYRSDLVRESKVFYNEKNIHADTEVCFALLRKHDFGFVHQLLTYTRIRPESLAKSSEDLHTYWAGMLQLLLAHGPNYLTSRELKVLLRDHMSSYYKFLGKSLLAGKRRILEYHRKKLAEMGMQLRTTQIAAGMLSTLGDLALSPKSTAKKLLKHRPDEDVLDSRPNQLTV